MPNTKLFVRNKKTKPLAYRGPRVTDALLTFVGQHTDIDVNKVARQVRACRTGPSGLLTSSACAPGLRRLSRLARPARAAAPSARRHHCRASARVVDQRVCDELVRRCLFLLAICLPRHHRRLVARRFADPHAYVSSELDERVTMVLDRLTSQYPLTPDILHTALSLIDPRGHGGSHGVRAGSTHGAPARRRRVSR